MLDLTGLQTFLTVARTSSLVLAADELSLSASAVSKSIKRLEQSIKTRLFDRTGRTLQLNTEGQRLLKRAQALLVEAEKIEFDFSGADYRFRCRFCGPSSLLLRYAQPLSEKLIERYPMASAVFTQLGEREALDALSRGDAEFALVGNTAMRYSNSGLFGKKLGSSEFKVAIGAKHALFKSVHRKPTPVESVLEHDFVVPLRPMFVGLERTALDGWRDDVFERRVRYRCDDLLLLKRLVDSGKVLAYLPDYLIKSLGLHAMDITGCRYRCLQEVQLVYNPGAAFGWMQWMVS
jgi:DNA-binding transcriptional LysR family regulator